MSAQASAASASTLACRLAQACATLDAQRGDRPRVPSWPQPPAPAARAPAAPRAIADRAVGWLDAHLQWFDPQLWERHLPPRPFPGGPVLELLLLCRQLREHPTAANDAFVSAAVEIAERVVERPEFVDGLYRAPQLFTYHLWLLAALEALDGAAGGARTVAEALLSAGRTGLPNPGAAAIGALELRHVLDLAALPADLPPVTRLGHRWWREHTRNPLVLGDRDVYALTHAVFYCTDFGRFALPLSERERRELVELVVVLLGAALARRDADLGAELLHAARIAGGRSHPAAVAGWAQLSHAQRPDGAIPGPLFEAATAHRLRGERAIAYAFGTGYHTTVVGAIAALDRDGS